MIKGLIKPIEDMGTGAQLEYHALSNASIDFKNNTAYVVISSYINKGASEHGKNHISTLTLTVSGDFSVDTVNELYKQIISTELFAGAIKDE
jgi:hypothetical protein